MEKVSLFIIIGLLVILNIFTGATAWTYYRRYNISQAVVATYIREYERLRSGFEDARGIIQSLGERNKTIAKAARDALELLGRKYKTQEE